MVHNTENTWHSELVIGHIYQKQVRKTNQNGV